MKKYLNTNIFTYAIYIISTGLFLYSLTNALKFALIDKTPYGWDDGYHLYNTLIFLQNFDFNNIISQYTHYPPFMYWLLALYFKIFHFSKTTIVLFNYSLLASLLFIINWFSRHYFNKLITSLNTLIALGLFFSMILYHSGYMVTFMLDIPLIVTVTFSYCLFLIVVNKSDSKNIDAIYLGISISIALLTKWTAIAFLAGPALFYIFKVIRQRKIINLILFISIIFIFSGWWYLIHAQSLINDYFIWTDYRSYTNENYKLLISADSYIYYLLEQVAFSFIWIIPAIYLSRIKPVDRNSGIQINKSTVIPNVIPNNILTIEIFYLLISMSIFFLLPLKDYRFIYPGVFLFLLSCFWYLIRTVNSKSIYLVAVSLVIYSGLTVYNFKLSPYTGNTAISELKNYLKLYPANSFAYFFEYDEPEFNYSNVNLLHTELSLFANSENAVLYLNDTSKPDACSYNFLPDTIVIYSSIVYRDTNPAENYYSFKQTCPKDLQEKYRISKQIDFPTDDRITFLNKIL